jgi:DNA modification methylase
VILLGDCRERMRELDAESVDAVVTDPPYHLTQASRGGSPRTNDPATPYGRTRLGSAGFMGKTWDGGDVAHDPTLWAEAFRVMKPGAHLVAFGGTRTFHRLTCAIEDAGFEIRDCLSWLYGSGFPKSLDVSKAIDKAAGCVRPRVAGGCGSAGTISTVGLVPGEAISGEAISGEAIRWNGWGTALKPAWEPIILARKPLIGTVAANVLAHGTGAINVDGCRIGTGEPLGRENHSTSTFNHKNTTPFVDNSRGLGRWPANVLLDEEAARALDIQSGMLTSGANPTRRMTGLGYHGADGQDECNAPRGADSGGASRFFYTAKASRSDREAGNNHPTVKPVSLMRWLVRLVTPPGGLVLDPFAGSGSTGVAAEAEGLRFVGIELDPEYAEIARRRIENVAPLFEGGIA